MGTGKRDGDGLALLSGVLFIAAMIALCAEPDTTLPPEEWRVAFMVRTIIGVALAGVSVLLWRVR